MKAFLNFVSYYLPKKQLSNEEISAKHPEWSAEKIAKKVGIQSRHIAGENETASDMAFDAAEELFRQYDIHRDCIDYLILCSQSPDYKLPSTSCILQNRLALQNTCGTFDYNLGCSGYVYGLGIAKGLIVSKQAKSVLLLTAETYTKYLSENDKGNKTIFGDAATASLISDTTIEKGLNFEIGEFSYATDGSKYDSLIVKNGGAKYPYGDDVDLLDDNGNFVKNDNKLFMNGKAIFDFTAVEVPKLVKDNLLKNNTDISQIDLVIFHQANEYMLRIARQRCNIPPERFFFDITNVGNTVSNSIPIAIKKAEDVGRLANVKSLLLTGFGVGLSMGSVVLTK